MEEKRKGEVLVLSLLAACQQKSGENHREPKSIYKRLVRANRRNVLHTPLRCETKTIKAFEMKCRLKAAAKTKVPGLAH